MTDPFAWYDKNAGAVAALYEQVAADAVHGWLASLLPKEHATVLDVGAGTGRDAAWLAAQGHEVVAVEPSAGMRAEASRIHPEASVRWVSDALPELSTVTQSGVSFNVILLSAVWMHVAPSERGPGAGEHLAAALMSLTLPAMRRKMAGRRAKSLAADYFRA